MTRKFSRLSFYTDLKIIIAVTALFLVFIFLGTYIFLEIQHTAKAIGAQGDLKDKVILLTNLTKAQNYLIALLFSCSIVIFALCGSMSLEASKKALWVDALAEKRLAAIEAAGDGIGIIDHLGRLTYMNRALMNLHGINTEDTADYIGQSWTHLYTEKGRQAIIGHVLPLLQKEGFWRGESPIVRKDGTIVYAEMSLTRLKDGDIIGTARDITEQRKTKAEKDELHKQFIQAQKMEALGRLTGGIAHDFNNMLTVISGNLDIIEDYISELPAIEKNVLAASRAVERGSELTQRLLAFSRKQVLKPAITNINDVIPETIQLIRRTLPADIEISFIPGENLWPVEIDVGQLENAILNLCINARDAMEGRDSNKITLRTENVLLNQESPLWQSYMVPGAYTMISVTDTGHGIALEIIERVFEPFFTTKEASKGSGLGLSMVFGFVKQSGGYVTISSTVNIGTTVSLFFPPPSLGTVTSQ